jgi:hypothetical protein
MQVAVSRQTRIDAVAIWPKVFPVPACG